MSKIGARHLAAWTGRRCRFRTGGSRFAKDRSGVTAIEFGMLALPFFLVVFAIMETSLIFLGELTLDNAVERVGRQVRTGEISKREMSEEDFRKAICGHVDFLMDCRELEIDLASYDDFSEIPATPPVEDGDIDTEGFGYVRPGRETITALRVYYKWPIFTDAMRAYLSNMDDGSHLIAGMAAFRTEPF